MTSRSSNTNKNLHQNSGEDSGLNKLVRYTLLDTLAYKKKGVLCRIIVKRITGSITLYAFDTGAELDGKNSPFDTFMQVIEGAAILTANEKQHTLKSGDAMIIPANTHHHYKAAENLKVLFTVIKSGYEE